MHVKFVALLLGRFFGIDCSMGCINVSSTALFLHVGSLVVLCIYFWKDNFLIATSILHKNNDALKHTSFYHAIIATISTITMTLIYSGKIQTTIAKLDHNTCLFATNIIAACLLYLSDKYSKQSNRITYTRSIVIGCAQFLASITGVSRLGISITCCRLMGINKIDSVKFSMFLAIPTIIGSIARSLIFDNNALCYTDFIGIACISAVISGLLFIIPCTTILKKCNYIWILLYRVIIGFSVLLLTK